MTLYQNPYKLHCTTGGQLDLAARLSPRARKYNWRCVRGRFGLTPVVRKRVFGRSKSTRKRLRRSISASIIEQCFFGGWCTADDSHFCTAVALLPGEHTSTTRFSKPNSLDTGTRPHDVDLCGHAVKTRRVALSVAAADRLGRQGLGCRRFVAGRTFAGTRLETLLCARHAVLRKKHLSVHNRL